MQHCIGLRCGESHWLIPRRWGLSDPSEGESRDNLESDDVRDEFKENSGNDDDDEQFKDRKLNDTANMGLKGDELKIEARNETGVSKIVNNLSKTREKLREEALRNSAREEKESEGDDEGMKELDLNDNGVDLKGNDSKLVNDKDTLEESSEKITIDSQTEDGNDKIQSTTTTRIGDEDIQSGPAKEVKEDAMKGNFKTNRKSQFKEPSDLELYRLYIDKQHDKNKRTVVLTDENVSGDGNKYLSKRNNEHMDHVFTTERSANSEGTSKKNGTLDSLITARYDPIQGRMLSGNLLRKSRFSCEADRREKLTSVAWKHNGNSLRKARFTRLENPGYPRRNGNVMKNPRFSRSLIQVGPNPYSTLIDTENSSFDQFDEFLSSIFQDYEDELRHNRTDNHNDKESLLAYARDLLKNLNENYPEDKTARENKFLHSLEEAQSPRVPNTPHRRLRMVNNEKVILINNRAQKYGPMLTNNKDISIAMFVLYAVIFLFALATVLMFCCSLMLQARRKACRKKIEKTSCERRQRSESRRCSPCR